MLIELSESKIEKNIIGIINYLFEEGSNELFEKFMRMINNKDNMTTSEFNYELENIFILHTRYVVDISYRSAINLAISTEK
jgi:hypothetical protein